MLTAGPKGTNDILPGEVEKWHFLEGVIKDICHKYGYQEIRTPVFEHTELFARGVGETTDVVEKEMYTFKDKGERSLTLRPEGTASTVRAYVQNKIYAQPQPTKMYYVGPMFRYANVQAGRYRQFHQFGVEAFGSNDPIVDAEVIAMAMDFYERIGLKDLELHINSVGCPECRPKHREALHNFLGDNLDRLCKLCQSRFERNPMRVLDCKEERCQEASKGAPTNLQHLCESCAEHFEKVKGYLDSIGLKYVVNERLVRGLDYYTHTAFEIMSSDIGAQSSIGGGGRYNKLIEEVGGPATPGIGFALGLERILAAMERKGIEIETPARCDVYLAVLGEEAKVEGFRILDSLRKKGISAEVDNLGRSLKAQMKFANKLNVKYAVILGENELAEGKAPVRNMGTGDQEEVVLENLIEYLMTEEEK